MSVLLVTTMMINLFSHSPAIKVPVHAFSPEQMTEFYHADKQHRDFIDAEFSARRVYWRHGCGDEYTRLTAETALANHVPAKVVAAIIVVESSCRANAISPEHAIGLMQVIPSYHHTTRRTLLVPEKNIRIGTAFLAQNVRRFGLREGIAKYNGGSEKELYAAKVLEVAR